MKLLKKLKKRPDVIWLLPITITAIVSQLLIGADCIFGILPIAEESALAIMATGAEIIAGLYGLTLTGYIFFMDYLQEQIRDNALVAEVVTLLRKRYYKMICFISLETVAAIIMTIALNFYDIQSNFIPMRVLRFLVNETLFFMINIVFAIIYFVLDIVNPDKIARVSLKHKEILEEEEENVETVIPVDVELENSPDEAQTKGNLKAWLDKKKMEKKTESLKKSGKRSAGADNHRNRMERKGDLQEFLKDYQEIEEILMEGCKGLAANSLRRNPFNPVALREAVISANGKDPMLFAKITRLHQYYSYMMFSNEQTVSKRMCNLAKEIKTELLNMKDSNQ